jgi:hypothetical protein
LTKELPQVRSDNGNSAASSRIHCGRAELARLPAAAPEIWEFGKKEEEEGKKGEREKEKVAALRYANSLASSI